MILKKNVSLEKNLISSFKGFTYRDEIFLEKCISTVKKMYFFMKIKVLIHSSLTYPCDMCVCISVYYYI